MYSCKWAENATVLHVLPRQQRLMHQASHGVPKPATAHMDTLENLSYVGMKTVVQLLPTGYLSLRHSRVVYSALRIS